MTSWTEGNVDLVIPDQTQRSLDVSSTLYLMIDVLDARPIKREERNCMVNFINAHERGVPDMI